MAKAGIKHNIKEIVKWVEELATETEKNIFREMTRSLTDLLAAINRRVPVSAASKSKAGGIHLASRLFEGLVKRGNTVEGFVKTDVGYAQYTEIKGRNKRINVGTAESPTIIWPAKRNRLTSGIVSGAKGVARVAGQTMPWMQSAWALDVRDDHMARMRKVAG